jgi:hypothetical protein
VTLSKPMRVITRWPALIPAITKAGHEPVLLPSDDNTPSMSEAAGVREQEMPAPPVTARPRGARR